MLVELGLPLPNLIDLFDPIVIPLLEHLEMRYELVSQPNHACVELALLEGERLDVPTHQAPQDSFERR